MQEATDYTAEAAFVNERYTGEEPAVEAAKKLINLEVVKHHEAQRGFVLLPRRGWSSARSTGSATFVVSPAMTGGSTSPSPAGIGPPPKRSCQALQTSQLPNDR